MCPKGGAEEDVDVEPESVANGEEERSDVPVRFSSVSGETFAGLVRCCSEFH